jgi:hypothetical protein
MSGCKLKVLVADDSRLIQDVFQQISAHSPIACDVAGRSIGARFSKKPFNAADIDRELELFELRRPLLAGVEPMRLARAVATADAPAEAQW